MLLGEMFFYAEVCDILTALFQLIKRLQVLTLYSTPIGSKILTVPTWLFHRKDSTENLKQSWLLLSVICLYLFILSLCFL